MNIIKTEASFTATVELDRNDIAVLLYAMQTRKANSVSTGEITDRLIDKLNKLNIIASKS